MTPPGSRELHGRLLVSFADPELEVSFLAERQVWATRHCEPALLLGFAGALTSVALAFVGGDSGTRQWLLHSAGLNVVVMASAVCLLKLGAHCAGRYYGPAVALGLGLMAIRCALACDYYYAALRPIAGYDGLDLHPATDPSVLVIGGVLSAITLLGSLSQRSCLLVTHVTVAAFAASRACGGMDKLWMSLATVCELYWTVMLVYVFKLSRERALREQFLQDKKGPTLHSKPPEVLTVPYPPQRHQGVPTSGDDKPNAKLASLMTGRRADWPRIRQMVERVRYPEYSLPEFFEDCIGSFPELELFGALYPRDGLDLPALITRHMSSGQSPEAEYQRTIGALFSVYWLLRLKTDGRHGWCFGVDSSWRPLTSQDDAALTEIGKERLENEKRRGLFDKMDWSLFESLVVQGGCAEGTPGSTDSIMALLCLTAFHDIMKMEDLLPTVQPEHSPYHGITAGNVINDHDVALSYILEHYPRLLPSYVGLPQQEQMLVLFAQGKMHFNHGWFVQAEAPPGALTKFKSVLHDEINPNFIAFYFLHWFTDLAGAEATPLGGAEKFALKFPHEVLASFVWSVPYVARLSQTNETSVMESYIKARWQAMSPGAPIPSGSDAIACMRLAMMAQSDSRVVDLFRCLPIAERVCLATEMARSGCAGQHFTTGHFASQGPALLIYYGPALLQKNAKGDLFTALRVLATVMSAARSLWPLREDAQGTTVTVHIAELKSAPVAEVVDSVHNSRKQVFVMRRHNSLEGSVMLKSREDAEKSLRDKPAEHVMLDLAACVQPCKMEQVDLATLLGEPNASLEGDTTCDSCCSCCDNSNASSGCSTKFTDERPSFNLNDLSPIPSAEGLLGIDAGLELWSFKSGSSFGGR